MKPYCTHCRSNDHWTSSCADLAKAKAQRSLKKALKTVKRASAKKRE